MQPHYLIGRGEKSCLNGSACIGVFNGADENFVHRGECTVECDDVDRFVCCLDETAHVDVGAQGESRIESGAVGRCNGVGDGVRHNAVAEAFKQFGGIALECEPVVVFPHFAAYFGHVAREDVVGAVDKGEVIA